jgi:hypothetical protein
MFRIASVGVSGLMVSAPMFEDAAAPDIAIAAAKSNPASIFSICVVAT